MLREGSQVVDQSARSIREALLLLSSSSDLHALSAWWRLPEDTRARCYIFFRDGQFGAQKPERIKDQDGNAISFENVEQLHASAQRIATSRCDALMKSIELRLFEVRSRELDVGSATFIIPSSTFQDCLLSEDVEWFNPFGREYKSRQTTIAFTPKQGFNNLPKSLRPDRLWLLTFVDLRESEKNSAISSKSGEAKNKGGRKPKYDWQTAQRAFLDRIEENGTNPIQARDVDWMREWFMKNGLHNETTREMEVPSNSQLEKCVKEVSDRLKSDLQDGAVS